SLQDFADAADHGIHDLDVTLGAGAENGAQLSGENILVRETESNRAESEKWVSFGRLRTFAMKLIPTEVECPDNHPIGSHRLRDVPVFLILLFLGRKLLPPQIQKLRAK